MLDGVSPTHSTIEGDGIVSIVAHKLHLVKVTAKDYSGVDVGTGGAHFYIQVTNHCTFTSNFECTAVGGADTTIQTDIWTEMNDSGDGTYYYHYQAEGDGQITVAVVLMNQGKIKADWYSNTALTGTPALIQYLSSIYTFTSGNVYTGRSDALSGEFEAYIYASVSGTHSFTIYNYQGATVYIDNVSN